MRMFFQATISAEDVLLGTWKCTALLDDGYDTAEVFKQLL